MTDSGGLLNLLACSGHLPVPVPPAVVHLPLAKVGRLVVFIEENSGLYQKVI